MKNWRIICLVWLISCSFQGWSQELSKLIDSADKELEMGRPLQAFKLYKRIAFYSGRNDFEWNYLQAAFQAKLYDESFVLAQNMIQKEAYEDSLYLFKIYAISAINSANYQVFQSDDPYEMSRDETLHQLYLHYGLLANFRQKKWPETFATLDTLVGKGMMRASHSDSLKQILNNLLSIQAKEIGNKSLIVPGLGQLALKDYKNASHAFLLNAGLISAMVVSSVIQTPLDGILFWLTPVSHYYIGNANAAYELAQVQIQKLEVEFETVLMR
ncbi:MAG: hypothetical protein ACOVP1_00675 [Bacteroidia bacterium]